MDPPVTASRNRLDELRVLRVVTKRCTQALDRGIQAVLEIDKSSVGPKLPKQLFALDHLARSFQQQSQNLQRLSSQRHARVPSSQFPRAEVEKNRVKSRHSFRPATGPAAYEYYLRGRQHPPRMTKAELQKSGEMFARAIELDAAYPPAFAGLATVHATMYEWFGGQADDLLAAERASERALDLAPGMAEAHVAHGCALALSRRPAEAERAFEQAIRINPNLFDAYCYSARTNFARGDIAASAARFRKAAEVRQDDFQSPLLLSQSLRMLGRLEDAAQANKEGIRRAEHVLALNPLDGRALSLGASALFHDGRTAQVEWSRRSLDLYPDDMSTLVNAACLHAKLGQKEDALELLERVFARGWGKRDWVEHDPDYDILRDDPRFLKLLVRLK